MFDAPDPAGSEPRRPSRTSEPSLAALAQFFIGESTMGETLDRLAEHACRAVEPAKFVGITMMLDGKPGTYVYTDGEAPEVDRGQYEVGDGPCLRALREAEVVEIASTRTDPRWPHFTDVALQHGILSTLSMPLVAHQRSMGGLNFYAGEEHAFTEMDRETAGTFATQASFVLANSQDYWDVRMLNENLQKALDSRAVIEQAKGIIMATRRCPAEDAFRVLVEQSQHENKKIRDLAAWIVRDASR